MSLHYNAFISYRHKPDDIRVAEEVQRQLERFVIPPAIRRKTGVQRIERIFRDKEELPITANLTSDIEEALLNSDFLIVICSPDTKESRWVQREIDLFLEHHDQNHVLTVLAAGEPGEVIPERLLKVTRIVKDAEGNEIEISEEMEPLSADYRLPFRQANKTELPRLAAVLIGCAYDDLQRRRQQYETRRYLTLAGIIGSAAVIAIAYLIWSNQEIHKNYVQSLENLRQSEINRSHYLAAQSLAAYDNQDRILAVQLALEAMPDETHNRPLTAEAEYALSHTLGMYDAGNELDYSAVRLFETDGVIDQFFVGQDYQAIAAKDHYGTVYLFDAVTGEIEKKIPSESDTVHIYEGDDKGFFIADYNMLSYISWEDGKELWKQEFSMYSHKVNFDKESGYGTVSGYQAHTWFHVDGNRSAPIPSETSIGEKTYYSDNAWAFPDEGIAFVLVSDNAISANEQRLFLADLENGTSTLLDDIYHSVTEIKHLENGSYLIFDSLNDLSSISSSLQGTTLLYDMTVRVQCLSASMEELWHTDLSSRQVGKNSFRIMKDDGLLLCTLSNLQYFIDLSNGETVHESQWPSSVSSSFLTGNGRVLSVLKDGSFAMASANGSSPDTVKTAFISGVEIAGKSRGKGNEEVSFLVLQNNSPSIIQYDSSLCGPTYRMLRKEEGRSFYASYSGKNHLGYVTSKDGEKQLSVYDFTRDDVVFTQDAADFQIDSYGFFEDYMYLIDPADYEKPCKLISLTDGSEKELIPNTGSLDVFSMQCAVSNGIFYWIAKDMEMRKGLCGRIDLSTFEETVVPMSEVFEGYGEEMELLADGAHAVIVQNRKDDISLFRTFLLNFETGKVTVLEEKRSDQYARPCGDESRFAIRSKDGILVYDLDGNLLKEIPCSIEHVPGFAFHEGKLHLLSRDGQITRLNEDGIMEKIYKGSEDMPSLSPGNPCTWIFEDNTLYLFAGGLFEMFDLNENQCRIAAKNVLAFDQENNRILILKTDLSNKMELGCFPIASAEELVSAGRALVGDIEMSADQRQLYGLEPASSKQQEEEAG